MYFSYFYLKMLRMRLDPLWSRCICRPCQVQSCLNTLAPCSQGSLARCFQTPGSQWMKIRFMNKMPPVSALNMTISMNKLQSLSKPFIQLQIHFSISLVLTIPNTAGPCSLIKRIERITTPKESTESIFPMAVSRLWATLLDLKVMWLMWGMFNFLW